MRDAGFTVIELSISIALGLILILGVLGLSTEAAVHATHVDDHSIVRHEANRSYERLAEVLRKTGWTTVAGVSYPRVSVDLAELEFRVLEDTDGNGFAFDQTTGELEWAPGVYTVRRDPDTRTLHVFLGSDPVWTLGRHIEEVEFNTFQQDNSIFLQEIRVRVLANRVSPKGFVVSHEADGSIHMRN